MSNVPWIEDDIILAWLIICFGVLVLPSIIATFEYYVCTLSRLNNLFQHRRLQLSFNSIIISIYYMSIHQSVYLYYLSSVKNEKVYEFAIFLDNVGFSLVLSSYFHRIWHVYYDRKLGRTKFNREWKNILNPNTKHKGDFFMKYQKCLGQPIRTFLIILAILLAFDGIYALSFCVAFSFPLHFTYILNCKFQIHLLGNQ